jgi:heme a synthase
LSGVSRPQRGREDGDRGFRLLAVGAAIAAWVLVAVGGVVRVTASGLGCPHWPLCTAGAVPLDERHSVIEYSHRAVVAVVVVLVVAVAVRAWLSYRTRRAVLWPALAALVLVPLQALLGAVVVWLTLPGWVVALHFVVGMVFLGTLVFTAAAAWPPAERPATRRFARLAWAAVLAGFALVCIGATVVALDAATACGKQWPGCNGGFVAGGAHADVQVAHRLLAYTVAALAVALLVLAFRGSGPRLAASLALLAVIAQASFGILIVVLGEDGRTNEILSGFHVGGAGTVWAALVMLAARAGDPRSSHAAQPFPSAAVAGV